MVLSIVGQWAVAHSTYIEAAVVALFISFVSSLPKQFPSSLQDYWTIFRDTLQGAIPLKYREQHNDNTNHSTSADKSASKETETNGDSQHGA